MALRLGEIGGDPVRVEVPFRGGDPVRVVFVVLELGLARSWHCWNSFQSL